MMPSQGRPGGFEFKIALAMKAARAGQTAVVIVPHLACIRDVINMLAGQVDHTRDPPARFTPSELHFEGTRGSVRIYPATHVTYDPKRKRLLDYPASIQHFLHPELEDT